MEFHGPQYQCSVYHEHIVGNVAAWADTTAEPEGDMTFFLSVGHRWQEGPGHRIEKPIGVEVMSICTECIGVVIDGPDVGDYDRVLRQEVSFVPCVLNFELLVYHT